MRERSKNPYFKKLRCKILKQEAKTAYFRQIQVQKIKIKWPDPGRIEKMADPNRRKNDKRSKR